MPQRPYLKVMHEIWLKEPILFVEKSRSMLRSWWGVAKVLHAVMTRQPAPRSRVSLRDKDPNPGAPYFTGARIASSLSGIASTRSRCG
jgi:hypothetical protein